MSEFWTSALEPAMDETRPLFHLWADVRWVSIASVWPSTGHFRSTPKTGHAAAPQQLTLCATFRLMHCSNYRLYSITVSTRASSMGGVDRALFTDQ
jgi:hypothetical protein